MIQARTPDELHKWREALPADARVGCVPTMGALHAGHRSLLERARAECPHVVMTLFVNRTQFNDPQDFESYPDTLEADLEMARKAGVDLVFLPAHEHLYPDGFRFRVTETEFSLVMEGAARPGHFDGVLTVVMKLLLLVRPHRAYFGEKDFQQYLLIRDMTRSFFLDTDIVSCPTIREEDGLAFSSRNVRLSPEGRSRAAEFPVILREAPDPLEAARRMSSAGFDVEYVEERGGRRFGAVSLEGVRLIDNHPLSAESVEEES